MDAFTHTKLYTVPVLHRYGKILLVQKVGGGGAAPPVVGSEAKGRERRGKKAAENLSKHDALCTYWEMRSLHLKVNARAQTCSGEF